MIDFRILISLVLGAFFWSLKRGQYDDLDGAAQGNFGDDDDRPARRN
jgi:cbb3-type cytochrome oxidase maturation protein